MKSAYSYPLFLECGFRKIFLSIVLFSASIPVFSQFVTIDSSVFHLRNRENPEWAEFRNSKATQKLRVPFHVKRKSVHTISLVQYDVKQNWNIFINQKKIGSLVTDGNRMRIYYKLLPEQLVAGENILSIEPASEIVDDIEISEISIAEQLPDEFLRETSIAVSIVDRASKLAIPARITIVDQRNILQSIGTTNSNSLAVRPGFIYTGDGEATVFLPAGTYTIYAGRGFEYSIDSFNFTITKGQKLQKLFSLIQEVDTRGWISSDTHIHTLTNSGHGDATDEERVLSIAGEGIEFPIITEHNYVSDIRPVARKMNVHGHFSAVIGNEITTSFGHFNSFAFQPGDSIPDHRINNWNELVNRLPKKPASVLILNHGRDIHNGFRPFDPKKHISIAGYRTDDWQIPATAMEIVNSGALLNEPMILINDWFGILNRGRSLSPIGASDSHDVSRYLVGQSRTYIKSAATDAGKLDVKELIENVNKGRVLISFGLLAKILVNRQAGPGDLAISSGNTTVDLEVHGPSWLSANKISLYANGIKVFEETIIDSGKAGLKWRARWSLPKKSHDVFLVAITEGPGPNLPYWPIVKPFQPVSTSWTPYTIGISGAVRIDADGDGKFTSAFGYASRLVDGNAKDFNKLFQQLTLFDESVSIQVAAILAQKNIDLQSVEVTNALHTATMPVKTGFSKFVSALNESRSQ